MARTIRLPRPTRRRPSGSRDAVKPEVLASHEGGFFFKLTSVYNVFNNNTRTVSQSYPS